MFSNLLELSQSDHERYSNKLSRIKVKSLLDKKIAFLANVGIDKTQTIKKDSNIPALAYTDGRRIVWFESTLNNYSVDDLFFIYLHECSHIAMNHVLWLNQAEGKCPTKLNKAMDYRINYDLEQILRQKTPDGMLIDDKYGPDWTINQIYDDLPDDASNDDYSDLDQSDPVSAEEHAADMNQAINRTVSQGNGESVPEEIKKYIDEYYKPKVDTQRLLRRYASEYIREGYDFNRPNRRYTGVFVPSMRSKGKTEVAVILDTSYSVTDEDVNVFLNEVRQALSTKSVSAVHAVQFNDTVVHEVKIKNVRDIERIITDSRGGTDIEPVMEWLDENKPKVAMVFTDGEFYFQRTAEEMPKTPIIWCINNTYVDFTPPKGKVIRYDPKKD